MSDLKEYKCPACGGAIEFDSRSQKMKCPYCDTEFDLDTLKAYEEQLSEEKKDCFYGMEDKCRQPVAGRRDCGNERIYLQILRRRDRSR